MRRDRRHAGDQDARTGQAAEDFAAQVDAWASYTESTWLYTHNVVFDLSVTNLVFYLGQLGWELSSRFAVGGESMWCILHKGARETVRADRPGPDGKPAKRVKWLHTLTIADSASLFPGPLAQLAQYVGVEKPVVDFETATDAEIAARCHADTEILKRAVLQMMDWWDANDLGHWTVTGPGQAWQTYKRTLGPRQVVIDHDPAILELERAAVYGGRRDVFRVGPLPPGRYGEIDYTAAYPTIAAEYPLPARAACEVNDYHRAQAMKGRVSPGMLAEVTICTPRPRWPVRIGGRVFYPTGRFRTTLAAPDIQAAADAHCLEAVHEGWLFTLTSHLRDWARLVLSWVNDKTGKIPGVVKIWAKAASRFAIGKYAQKGWRTERYYGPPCEGWQIEQCADGWTGTKGVMTGVNGEWWLSWADQRGEHERPAVLAFIESHTRRRLGDIIESPYGPAVFQCDTDGVMVSHTLLAQLAETMGQKWHNGRPVPRSTGDVIEYWNDLSYPLIMREKAQHARVVIHGAQQVVLDGKLRAAGVPRGAWKTDEQTYMARLWPGLSWQSRHAPPGGYARPVQPYRIKGSYAAAWALQDGTVRPVETAIGLDGETFIVKWEQTTWADNGDVLGPEQGKWADSLWEQAVDNANSAL